MALPQQRETGNIKILSIVWYEVLPPRFGGQKAVARFNQSLADLAPLVCLCSSNNVPGDTNYQIKNLLPLSKWQFLNPFVWRKIYRIAKQEKITHLILEFPYHGIAGFICKKMLGVCLVINTHNIEYLRFKQQKKRWWRILFFFEKWVLTQSDLVFFKTEADLDQAINAFSLKRSACEVIPYGAEQHEEFASNKAKEIVRKRHGISASETMFFFAGTLDYGPNADAVIAIYENLIPILNKTGCPYKVLVSGRNIYPEFSYLHRLKDEKLIMVGEVSDIDTYFQAVDVFLNPVLTGGGIQTKIIDALSFHVNVVCFQTKCSGIRSAGNKLLSVPDGDWEAFAKALIKMAHNNENTPADFFDTYHWPAIAGRAYQKLIAC